MSISGVGAYGSASLDQILRMLSRLDNTSGTTSTTSSNSSTTNSGSISAAPESTASSALTGTSQSSLSDQIMALLVQLQQQSTADGTQATNSNASTATQTTAANDPIQQLFSAMDLNGDGVVSQAEMESYIEGKGGTQAQADALFSALNQNAGGQNGSPGISEQQLAADVSQAQHFGHHHHHHHGGPDSGQASASSSSDIASQIFSALDTNQDGKVSAAELSAAFKTSNSTNGNGTSSTDPSSLFAQIDSNGDGSVTSDELGNFLTSLAKQALSDVSTLGAFAQLATQSYDASANLMNKADAGQSLYA
jgi:Ca2+-binding EF-hand superfamily protein